MGKLTPAQAATGPPPSPADARALQRCWASQVDLKPLSGPLTRVAGIDIGFRDGGRTTVGAAVVLSYPQLQPLEAVRIETDTRMPYIPGLLSFREVPAAVEALGRLSGAPDLILCDGQGIAHPRRFGLACHLGLILGVPTIGVAKSRLIGEHAALPEQKGDWVPLLDHGQTIGAVLRSRTGVKPLYISPGHLITLQDALEVVSHCLTRFRLPETTRWAHRLASGPFPLPDALAAVLHPDSDVPGGDAATSGARLA